MNLTLGSKWTRAGWPGVWTLVDYDASFEEPTFRAEAGGLGYSVTLGIKSAREQFTPAEVTTGGEG